MGPLPVEDRDPLAGQDLRRMKVAVDQRAPLLRIRAPRAPGLARAAELGLEPRAERDSRATHELDLAPGGACRIAEPELRERFRRRRGMNRSQRPAESLERPRSVAAGIEGTPLHGLGPPAVELGRPLREARAREPRDRERGMNRQEPVVGGAPRVSGSEVKEAPPGSRLAKHGPPAQAMPGQPVAPGAPQRGQPSQLRIIREAPRLDFASHLEPHRQRPGIVQPLEPRGRAGAVRPHRREHAAGRG